LDTLAPIVLPGSVRKAVNAAVVKTPETDVAGAIVNIAMLKSKALLEQAKAL
jgi:hypothetical protein